MRRIAAVLASLAVVCGLTLVNTPAQARYGHNTCGYHYKTARAVLHHTILGINAYAVQATCAQVNRYGTKYIGWTGTPHTSFIADNSLGRLQLVDHTWGPYMTRAVRTRQSPWHYPNIVNPAYLSWTITQAALGKPKIYRTTRVVHTYSVRVCTISFLGVHECSDGDYKTVNKIYYGLRVCSLAPDARCGRWVHFR